MRPREVPSLLAIAYRVVRTRPVERATLEAENMVFVLEAECEASAAVKLQRAIRRALGIRHRTWRPRQFRMSTPATIGGGVRVQTLMAAMDTRPNYPFQFLTLVHVAYEFYMHHFYERLGVRPRLVLLRRSEEVPLPAPAIDENEDIYA